MQRLLECGDGGQTLGFQFQSRHYTFRRGVQVARQLLAGNFCWLWRGVQGDLTDDTQITGPVQTILGRYFENNLHVILGGSHASHPAVTHGTVKPFVDAISHQFGNACVLVIFLQQQDKIPVH
ncbi:hypothetical protein HRbin36_02209 [bacterium HR36]|nr:hypothetical protein HRbin36_02209 [bacterium HR36]